MTGTITARNTTQQAGKIDRVQDTFVNATIGIYTVPNAKRTRATDIKGVVNTVGADATYAIAIKVFSTGLFKAITNFEGAGAQQSASAVTMEAGDILTNIGDSGATNANFSLSATIEEFGL